MEYLASRDRVLMLSCLKTADACSSRVSTDFGRELEMPTMW